MKTTLIATALVLFPALASAHAFLEHADPPVGAAVAKAPDEVKAWFTGPIEPAFSVLQVFTADGAEIDNKDCHLDPKDSTLLIVGLKSIPAGTYKVHWRVVAADTHVTQGDFKFTVKP